jgi:hypothetical protein
VSRNKQPRREGVAPPPSETVMGGAFLPLGVRSSNRCRARHDVPYSLRCLHDAGHQSQHEDKEGNRW